MALDLLFEMSGSLERSSFVTIVVGVVKVHGGSVTCISRFV